MGKIVAALRVEVPNWFYAGVITSPGFDEQVSRTLNSLLGPKSWKHNIGISGCGPNRSASRTTAAVRRWFGLSGGALVIAVIDRIRGTQMGWGRKRRPAG